MERPDKNPFPEFDLGLTDRLKSVARFVGRLLTPYPQEAPLFMSNHYRGASEMLDYHLKDSEGEALQPTLYGYDSEGCYIDLREY